MNRPHGLFVAVAIAITPMLQAQSFAEAVAKLAAAATFDDQAVGEDGHKSETWRNFEVVVAKGSTAELEALLAHEKPIVRAYGVRALLLQEVDPGWKRFLLDHLADAAEITAVSGCVHDKKKVGDVFVELIRPKLSDDDVLDLAEAALRHASPLYFREWALRNLKWRDGVLHLIRDLARRGEAPAAIALARYGLEPDVATLGQHVKLQKPFVENAQFLAAAISRHPKLLPPLVAHEAEARRFVIEHSASSIRFWLEAIAAQQTTEAARFLVEFLRGTRSDDPFRERSLLNVYKQVLVAYPTATVFDDVRAELKKRHAELRK